MPMSRTQKNVMRGDKSPAKGTTSKSGSYGVGSAQGANKEPYKAPKAKASEKSEGSGDGKMKMII